MFLCKVQQLFVHEKENSWHKNAKTEEGECRCSMRSEAVNVFKRESDNKNGSWKDAEKCDSTCNFELVVF